MKAQPHERHDSVLNTDNLKLAAAHPNLGCLGQLVVVSIVVVSVELVGVAGGWRDQFNRFW